MTKREEAEFLAKVIATTMAMAAVAFATGIAIYSIWRW